MVEKLVASDGKGKQKSGSVIFVSDFVHINGELDSLMAKLAYDHASWLAPIANETASLESSGAKVKVGSGVLMAKTVDVVLGEPRIRPNAVVVPMVWTPTGTSKLFPTLEADLELSALDSGVCRLGITGRYRVPLGVIGEVVNNAFMHRIAEDTIRRFLTQIASVLES
ncbi:MAG: hypothetical protein M1374_07005 [Firmicutes bacterium]|jgi:hypothetical protein|nr:hypothetical protein [Bacillota bacterium]